MKNLPHLLFRLDTNPPVPTATTAKANPLDSIEIDGNFKSIYNSLQSIPDILSSGDIVAGTALNNLVDHKGMIQYVDKEIASINIPVNNLSTNGYQYLAGGLIIQWGSYTEWDEAERTYDFPIEFPTAALNITCGNNNPRYMSYATIINKKSFKVASRDLDPGTADSGGAIYSYFAIGY